MSNLKLHLVLPFIAVLYLTGCGSVSGTNTTVAPPPAWPDEKVAAELENVPFVGFEDFWGWMDKVEKLNEQLEAARG